MNTPQNRSLRSRFRGDPENPSQIEVSREGLDENVVTKAVVVRSSLRDRMPAGIALTVLGVATMLFALTQMSGGHKAHIKIDQDGSWLNLPDIVLPGLATVLLAGLIITAIGVWHLWAGFNRSTLPWMAAVAGVLFIFAFLVWVSQRGDGVRLDLIGLLQNTMGYSVPLILGALAGLMCERSGVINVAIEGQMLAGAWAAALIGSLVGSIVGLAGAAVAGALMGALLALFAVKYLVNQVILGVVLNVLAAGLTGFFYDAFMQPNAHTLNQPKILGNIDIPLLSKIPIIGPLFFQQTLVVYLMYALIIIIDIALFRTRWGLRTRAVGEHPKAADTVGINVLAVRYRNVILGGAIAGLGGAYFTVGSVGAFGKNITSGAGFIALAALIFGKWSPRGAVLAALLFGFSEALGTTLSLTVPSIPSNFLAMLPYLATIFAVAGLVGQVRAPAADGEPYVKG